jgi:hypothetical protein
MLAPSGAGPSIFDLFVIVDKLLTLRAVSRSAEIVLATEQLDAAGTPLARLLISDEAGELADAVELAIRHTSSSSPSSQLRTVAPPVVSFTARIMPCGPPRAALLILTPASSHERETALVGQEANGVAHSAEPPRHRPPRQRRPRRP